MQGFAWSNHITGSESSWSSVLGEGVTYASKPDRAPIAREARRDRAGYQRLLRAAPPTLRPSIERLYALSLALPGRGRIATTWRSGLTAWPSRDSARTAATSSDDPS